MEKHIYSLKVENILKEILQENRKNDLSMSQTSVGAHKSKLICKVIPEHLVEKSSTGEQKMMLISIIFSFIKLVQKIKHISPILLLDEINVHLDKNNMEYIMEKILQFNAQIFITTTHKRIYENFTSQFEFLKIR